MGTLATSTLPFKGSPMRQSGKHNKKGTINGRIGYIK